MTQLKLKILIAEDEPDMAELYAETLRRLGHGVFITKDGEECLSAYRYATMKAKENSAMSPFDVVIVDYSMPKKDGVTLTKEILAENPKQKIIFVSAHGNILLNELEGLHGDIDFLSKPVSTMALAAKVEGKRVKDVVRSMQQES